MYDPSLITLLKMRPHHSQSSRENTMPLGGTSPYKEDPPGGRNSAIVWPFEKVLLCESGLNAKGKKTWFCQEKPRATRGSFLESPDN